jgi:hypothetical protein
VPRVGRKKAEQLILDLADKLDDLQVAGLRERRGAEMGGGRESRTQCAPSSRWATRRPTPSAPFAPWSDDGGRGLSAAN